MIIIGIGCDRVGNVRLLIAGSLHETNNVNIEVVSKLLKRNRYITNRLVLAAKVTSNNTKNLRAL